MRNDIIMNKVFKRSGQDDKVQSEYRASMRTVTPTEVSSARHVSRCTASTLEKHDWQAPMLSDLYFSHTDSTRKRPRREWRD